MRKRIIALALIATMLFAFPCAVTVYASQHSGLFIASDYSEAYHVLFCRDASKIGKSRSYYTSTDEAEDDGKRPCQHCGSYIRIIRGDYTGTEQERELVDAYLKGYYAGENAGYISGSDDWYSDGYDHGYSAGTRDAKDQAQTEYEAKLEEEISSVYSKTFWISVFSFIPLIIFISCRIRAVQDRKFDAERTSLRNQLKDAKLDYDQQILRIKNKSALNHASLDTEILARIPKDVHLLISCIPIKGTASKNRPFGDYTVYTTKGGKKYHCKCHCSGAELPVHFLECPPKLEPCSICVPKDMYLQPLPDWYLQITRMKPSNKRTDSPPTKPPAQKPVNRRTTSVGPAPSTGIDAAAYKDEVLYISFGNGKTFAFYDVPESVCRGMLETADCVTYYRMHIDGVYPYMLTREEKT